jgi:hypothetical protein
MAEHQNLWLYGQPDFFALAAKGNETWKDRMTGSPNDTKYQVLLTTIGGLFCLIMFMVWPAMLQRFVEYC